MNFINDRNMHLPFTLLELSQKACGARRRIRYAAAKNCGEREREKRAYFNILILLCNHCTIFGTPYDVF